MKSLDEIYREYLERLPKGSIPEPDWDNEFSNEEDLEEINKQLEITDEDMKQRKLALSIFNVAEKHCDLLFWLADRRLLFHPEAQSFLDKSDFYLRLTKETLKR